MIEKYRPSIADSQRNEDSRSLEERAHEFAESVAGPRPEMSDYPTSSAYLEASKGYWDTYYEVYHERIEDEVDACLGWGHDDHVSDRSLEASPFLMEDDPLFEDAGEEVFDDRTLGILRKIFSIGLNEARAPQRPRADATFFRYPEARKEVFEFSKAITEYLKESNIRDLVVVDRSSRPLYIGVKEYWNNTYPNERMPNIYFINPKGFKSVDSSTFRELRSVNEDAMYKDDRDESVDVVRTEGKIMDEFRKTYTKLLAHKDEPVLIFDTCIHRGETLSSVVDIFHKLGFSKLKVGAVNPADPGAKVTTDFYITEERPEGGCYPFDRDRMIEKTFEHVFSVRSHDAEKRAMGAALRSEIKTIMHEYM